MLKCFEIHLTMPAHILAKRSSAINDKKCLDIIQTNIHLSFLQELYQIELLHTINPY